jgi:hypothetical protein
MQFSCRHRAGADPGNLGDFCGLDAKLMSILKGSERQAADVAIERPADPNFKPTPEQGQRLRSVAGSGGSPFGLFDRLFRLKPAENLLKRAGFPVGFLNLVNNLLDFAGAFSPYSPRTTC